MSTKKSSPGKIATKAVDNYFTGIEKVRDTVDKVPYENFPFCCTTPVVAKAETDLTGIKIVKIPKKP